MEARYPARDLIQITDPAGHAIQIAALTQALTDASAEIDGYIESRFALPLSDPPAVLNRLACDIAMYRLQALRPLHNIEDARQRYEDAVKVLEQVAQGKVTLGLSSDGIEPPIAQAVEMTEGPRKMFTRRRLRGY